ncbi:MULTISPECIES: flagellar motor stator protein MotA [Yersinia pseudotuberculosis complex]|uniref:Chemotaxis protein MotA n=1 Tax=Yersinia pseudotuberculosis serotype O:1b (strain IP 31758) TaxID=349747 RepID=A0A0U1QUA9_YERP3|nr:MULTISPECIES: flagellar motor stator protein MotA [Yersinia pseudotuberculosis complex]ABS46007.1 chemotaxis protein MotA [Yersinia pseudotuberculosis IP 31758]AJK18146.1 flagellar motor stator protein MotA [Yersinia pseudotuberculosis str. PA3606]MCE4114619.1 flagellar motor stator protein MotA [Yersinia pseudotuberculosis]MCF1165233.1 flagellar motor stator protein MotA [Yersinia pseudotuberculosis]RYC18693.1 flagellar motor stator protein MotA [Yersinia pseudotuberculosis]
MQKIFGLLVIMVCVIGGYLMSGGVLSSFWQPGEIIIIFGSGIGAMILGNPRSVLKDMWHQILAVTRRSEYTGEFQQQLLLLLYELLEMVDEGGLKRLDEHIEIPANSSVFQRYPLILQDLHLITFISDNFRLMAMGKINQHELESILEQELSAVEEELLVPSRSFQRIGEAMPGFGICAAVLGIIITMQSIDGSIAMIGVKVAAALIGTFLGVFICYCLMDPLANAMEQEIKKKLALFECVRMVLVNHVAGKPSLLAVDAGRKMLPMDNKPTFATLDSWINKLITAGV